MLNIAALRQQQIPLAAEPRSPVPFHILMKPIGPACNLACRYCYYPQDETPVNKMDDITVIIIILIFFIYTSIFF